MNIANYNEFIELDSTAAGFFEIRNRP